MPSSNVAFTNETESVEELWNIIFSEDNIRQIFYKHIYPKGGQGVDRISVRKYETILDQEIEIIRRKVLLGTYKFSPYLEQLKSKGQKKLPRVISIPTVRDKLVLKLLTEFLHVMFSENLAKDLPNTVVKKMKKALFTDHLEAAVLKLDIENFYPSIKHEILIENLKTKADYRPFINIITKAVKNPTLPAGYKASQKKEYSPKGIPQGLSISNILAEIYITPLDDNLKTLSTAYFRFVDDIFILCDPSQSKNIWRKIVEVTTNLELKVNEDKSTKKDETDSITKQFDFLGYRFNITKQSVSASRKSRDRFINSVVNTITRFKHEKTSDNQTPELKKKVFLENLNERITGAIDENRRYGWIFFFSEIDDQRLLNEIDMVINRVLKRVPKLNSTDIAQVKKLNRAYYEANHSPKRGYIHNYNEYKTLKQKMTFLADRGLIKKDGQYTEDLIQKMFDSAKTGNLLKLEKDTSTIS